VDGAQEIEMLSALEPVFVSDPGALGGVVSDCGRQAVVEAFNCALLEAFPAASNALTESVYGFPQARLPNV
jgi:hypothetical protein